MSRLLQAVEDGELPLYGLDMMDDNEDVQGWIDFHNGGHWTDAVERAARMQVTRAPIRRGDTDCPA